jgi:hypothetical protein
MALLAAAEEVADDTIPRPAAIARLTRKQERRRWSGRGHRICRMSVVLLIRPLRRLQLGSHPTQPFTGYEYRVGCTEAPSMIDGEPLDRQQSGIWVAMDRQGVGRLLNECPGDAKRVRRPGPRAASRCFTHVS